MKAHVSIARTAGVVALIMLFFGSVYCFADDDINCKYMSGTNYYYNDYSSGSEVVTSYLTTSGSNYMRVQGSAEKNSPIVIVYYDDDFNLIRRKTLDMELPYFGCFYESDSNYYIVTGQANAEESDEVEVFRVTKYNKNWNRLSSCSLYGANTYYPFKSGSCRVTKDGKYLLIRTCHSMYKTADDGLHHQANVTIQVDTETMKVTDQFCGIHNIQSGYVSHSFNQFIKVEDHKIVAVDHGDASPRGISLIKYTKDFSDGTFLDQYPRLSAIFAHKVYGSYADYGNSTGVSVGAFEISDTSYLVAGNSVYKNVQDGSAIRTEPRNAFIAAVNREDNTITTTWLTDFTNSGYARTPTMVKVAENKYIALWNEGTYVKYAFINGDGTKIGATYSMEGILSDCVPILNDGKIVWYSWKNEKETFYSISLNNPENTECWDSNYDHEYELVDVSDGIATKKCKKCGAVEKGKVPTSFYVSWKNYDVDEYFGYYDEIEADITHKIGCRISGIKYSAEAENIYSEMIVKSDNPNASIDSVNRISFMEAGIYNISVYPEFNPNLVKTCVITVTKPINGVLLNTSDSPQTYGEAVQLNAIADGGKPPVTYKFVAIDNNGNKSVIYKGSEESCEWLPSNTGSYTLSVTASDATEKTVSSEEITFEITKADKPKVSPSPEYNVPYTMTVLTDDMLPDGWTFEQKGTALEVGEKVTFTASYTGEDKACYETTLMMVSVTRSTCSHNEGADVKNAKEATCTEEGYSGDTYCKLCKELLFTGTTTQKKPHEYVGTVKIAATCISKGTMSYVCKNCHDAYEGEMPIDSSNHGNVRILEGKPATISEEGLTEGRVCDDCEAVIVKQTVISKLKAAKYDSRERIDLKAVKIAKPKAGKKSATIKWKKISKKNLKKIKKIQIQISSTKNFSSGVKTKYVSAKKKSYKIKGLKAKNKYYIRIRAYKKSGGVVHVSRWSKVKTIKVK